MAPRHLSEDFQDPLRGWHSYAAVAFVVATLVALVLVPWAVQRRVDAVRAEIQASEPARTLVMRWQFNLVREMAALSELLLSGDTAQSRTYLAAWTAERTIYQQVEPLAEQMGPPVVAAFVEARTLALQWHDRVRQDELAQLHAEGAPALEIPRERELFEDVLRAVAGVDSAIMRETAEARSRIVTAEIEGLRWTLILGMLALISALAVFALHGRVRRFAAEAERRRAESAAALAETARAAEQRTRLLRGITHDVKNPLGAAQGYAELLALGVKAPLAPEQAPLVAGVERSIASALAIIADLLDMARLEGGGVTMKRTRVDLNELVRAAVEDYRASADTSGHALTFEPASAQLTAHTDPQRIRQVIDNLLSNALKYTPAPGRITARVAQGRAESAPRAGEWATIEVSDTGPGIPPEHREEVFDEFARLDDSSPTRGHGLGLSIARGMSRQLGGDLTIADAGPGATFVLWIPQDERRDSAQPAARNPE